MTDPSAFRRIVETLNTLNSLDEILKQKLAVAIAANPPTVVSMDTSSGVLGLEYSGQPATDPYSETGAHQSSRLTPATSFNSPFTIATARTTLAPPDYSNSASASPFAPQYPSYPASNFPDTSYNPVGPRYDLPVSPSVQSLSTPAPLGKRKFETDSKGHGKGPNPSKVKKSNTPSPTTTPEKRVICRFYQKGNCAKGSACTFIHDLKKGPCIFHHFKRGGCTKSASCAFSHDPLTAEQLKVLKDTQKNYESHRQKQDHD